MHFAMATDKLSGRGKDMVPLSEDFAPGPGHVICAKGKQAKQHPANRLLRSLVQTKLKEYSECPSKLERSFIVSAILKTIRQNGGFVRNINGKWYDIGDRNSKEKIGQTFRDSLSHLYRSSTKAKASIRRQNKRGSGDSASDSSNPDSSQVSASTRNEDTYTFPISEVTIDKSSQQPDVAKSNDAAHSSELHDLEPIPLSQAAMEFPTGMEYDVSASTASSNASSFDSSMQDLYSHLSCSVLSSTTAPSMASSQFSNSAFQQQMGPNSSTAAATENQQQQSLLSNLQLQGRPALPNPYALRAQLAFSGHFGAYQTNTAPSNGPEQVPFLSLQVSSSAMLPSALEPTPIAPTSSHLLQQQRQQRQQQQQQQQQQNQQQQSSTTTEAAAGETNKTDQDQYVQSNLKSHWKRQFE